MIVEFEALNTSGKLISDSLVVDDIDQARQELLQRNLTPVQIRQGKQFALKGRSGLLSQMKGNQSGDAADSRKGENMNQFVPDDMIEIIVRT